MKKVKPDPLGAQADQFPWMVTRPYSDPLYYRTWKDARDRLRKDVAGEKERFERLKATDSIAACRALLDQIEGLFGEQPAHIDGLMDPLSGIRYRANIIQREVAA